MKTTLGPGARLGAFEILGTLGEGGMGAVYRARDTTLQRDVAIKVLLPAIADDPERLARFGREAQVLASLNHQNIAAIYGLENVGGVKALVLELVDGPTLADRIASGPLSLDDVLAVARQLADALGAAHEQGIVHRDLKPANIKVRPDGTVKVLDFGLAKATDPAAGSTTSAAMSPTLSPTMTLPVSMTGVILGTAAYMSPEQASGKPVDKRADIWAFGVVLWEMVTGRRMFEGETISHVLAAVLTKDPDLSRVPARLRRLLATCLEKDPRKRLRDIGDAMRFVDEGKSEPDHVQRAPAKRWPLLAAWSVAALAVVALGAALWTRPARVIDEADSPVVRLQIERPLDDPYNNAASAFAASPDGRFLAYYTVAAKDRAILSLQTLATGERREVPGSAVRSPAPPVWSPDSRQVMYVTTLNASVFDVVTGAAREICICRFQGGSWNRDGVILVGSASGDTLPIRRVSLIDPVPVPVTKNASGGRDSWPVFLPDGRRFIFTRTQPGAATATYMGALDGGEPRRISDGSRTMLATLPNGAGSLLLGIDAAGLVAQPIDLNAMPATGESVVVVAGIAAASVSNNGVLATSAAPNRPVVLPTWFDRNGTPQGAVGSAGALQAVTLAPDGRAVVAEIATGITSLRDAAGTDRRLSTGDSNTPVWSPDGRRIVVASRFNGVQNLVVRAVDGSEKDRRMFQARDNTYPADWSRDGRWIIYTIPKAASSPDLDLWVIRADEGDAKPVPYLTSLAREAQAEFSPDGRFVAYTSSAGNGDPEVYVQPFPNASDGKWLVSNGGGSEPHWSRDGKELFYFSSQTLMAVSVKLEPTFSSGTPARLFDAPVQAWYINDADRWQVGPDGKRFLLLVPAGKAEAPPLDIVVNWPTLLKK